jgi:hypothetical protein
MTEAQILLSQAASHLRVANALLFTAGEEIIESSQDLFDEDQYNEVKAMIQTLDATRRDLDALLTQAS